MPTNPFRLTLVTFLFTLLTSFFVNAVNIESLKSMEEAINQQPWKSYEQLKAFESKIKNDSIEKRLWFLMRKAQAENLLYFFEDFSNTVALAQGLVTTSAPIEIQSRLNLFSGLVSQRNGLYIESIRYLSKSITQAKENKLHHLSVLAKQELGYTRSLIELYETSLTDLQEAYVEAFALEDNFLIAVINETYGAIYGYMGEYEKSVDYYEKALDTYERLQYKAHIAEAVYGLASTYRYWKKYDQAIDKFQLYRKLVNYTPNKNITFFGAYGLGMSLAEKGDCQDALTVIGQALTLKGQVDYDGELYKRKAECLIVLQRLDEAAIAIKEAEDIFNSIPEVNGTRWQLEVIKIQGMLAYANGDSATGYHLINSYYQQYTELLVKNSTDRLAKVRAALELERQEVEISLLQQRSKVHELEMEQEQQKNAQQSYLIVYIICLVLFILVIMVIQQRNNKKVLALSIRDPLSDLFNRRYIFDFLDKILLSSTSQKTDLSIILFDIDEFKQINDRYGHPFGDEVIKKIAVISQSTLRAEDVIGRIGGEEFLCVMPRTDKEQSLVIANRLLENIANYQFETMNNEKVKVTVSIGLALMSEDIADSSVLYAQADRALYSSKNNGKNLVTFYHPSMDEGSDDHFHFESSVQVSD